jgi:hypothetical protein
MITTDAPINEAKDVYTNIKESLEGDIPNQGTIEPTKVTVVRGPPNNKAGIASLVLSCLPRSALSHVFLVPATKA